MAGLIEENIDGGSSASELRRRSAKTARRRSAGAAALLTARDARRDRAGARRRRAAVARRRAHWPMPSLRKIRCVEEPEPFGRRRRRAPVPAAAIPLARESAERPAVRPAFVSGGAKAHAPSDRTPSARARLRTRKRAPAQRRSPHATARRRAARTRLRRYARVDDAFRHPRPRRKITVAKADAARPARPGWMIQIGATEDQDKANQLLVARAEPASGLSRHRHGLHREGAEGNRNALSRAFRRSRGRDGAIGVQGAQALRLRLLHDQELMRHVRDLGPRLRRDGVRQCW